MRFALTDGLDDPVPFSEARSMTRSQLRQLGTPNLVYLRAGILGGEEAFAIYAADGTILSVVEDIDVAVEIATEQGMTFVAVH